MKKQINLALFLGFSFILWLFCNTSINWIVRKNEDKQNWAIFGNSQGAVPMIIIYNKVTGEAWRYFLNRDENKNITKEGLVSLTYTNNLGVHGYTPDVFIGNLKKFLDKEKERIEDR